MTNSFRALTAPIWRASTILFPSAESFLRRKERFFDGYTYGLAGTPTHTELARRLVELEHAQYCVLAPSGLGAINLVNHAVLRAGDHLLCCSSAYGPTQENAREVMGRFGVQAEFYDASEGAQVSKRFKSNTRLLWLEVPGSIEMQMADVGAIARAAQSAGILTAMDNTWATPLGFRPLEHGVTFSIQALTKFVGGHSDILMGSVCVNVEALFRDLKTTANLLGNNVSPDDCALVARGLDTLALRLQRHSDTTLSIAPWLERQPAVAAVHCPALPSHPGHEIWRRDFATAGSLCTIVLKDCSWATSARFIERLRLFQIGASWGGAHSLIAVYPMTQDKDAYVVRLHFGVEPVEDLISDLAQALKFAHAAAAEPNGLSHVDRYSA